MRRLASDKCVLGLAGMTKKVEQGVCTLAGLLKVEEGYANTAIEESSCCVRWTTQQCF